MANVVIRDESMSGRELDRWILPDVADVITVRELVRLRVREEVARHNADPDAVGDRFEGVPAGR